MYKLDLPVDYKEAAAIERRRNTEAQRQSRIFNAKTRLIGIDKQALNQQVIDKKTFESDENLRSEAFAADAVRNDKITLLLQQRQEQDARALNILENEFRQMHQQPRDRREWDLYDPDHLKKDKPARVHDDDPRCTISGCQKLDGEDLNNKARQNFQKEQRREWAKAQMEEKKQSAANEKKANDLETRKRIELDNRALQLQKADEDCRRAINEAVKDYNKAIANEQRERDRLNKQQEEDDKLTEIANNIYGDFLTENPAVAQSAFGPHRVIADRFKGMTPQQLDDIRNTQDIQRKEKQRRDQEEKNRDDEWERQANAHDRAALLLQREEDRQRRNILQQLADENRRLGNEQNGTKDFLNKQVYTNKPTAAYFMQFNTTSR